MKLMKLIYKIFLILAVVSFASCDDKLTELNVNPNGVDPAIVNPNLMVTSIITSTLTRYNSSNYQGGVAGVMNYVQKSGWGDELNKYNWNSEQSWASLYSDLRNAKHLYERSLEEGMEFQQGLSMVMRAFIFGLIADSWGDAPYTAALNAPNGEQEDLFPVFDSQESIYKGIIEELKQANTLLSKPLSEYQGIDPNADVLYNGNPAQWRKLANSLMLRYYMRVSTKLPAYAKAGIEEIISNSGTYPIFISNDDDATMGYIGSSDADAWPANTTFDANGSNFTRLQLCAGFRDVLVELNDPRIAVWFNKVKVQIQVSDAVAEDEIIDGVRYLNPDYMAANNMVLYTPSTWVADSDADKVIVDTGMYVGIPIASQTGGGSAWNLNPNVIQGGPNVHNSALAGMYQEAEGEYLRARLISYAEVSFILAEAAQKGWSVGGDAKTWYEEGVKASFDTWDAGDVDAYLATDGVAFTGSLEQIMTQKWIANWTVAHESWCDWRRTGLPALTVGLKGTREAMPLRAQYGSDEKARNADNYKAAINNLVETEFTAQDGKDSAWSKFWLLQ